MRPLGFCFRISVLCVLLAPALALGWGPSGHAYVGALADRLLSKQAAAQVKKIGGVPLATAALWADCVKDVEPAGQGKFRYSPHPVYHAPCVPFETKTGIARMESYVKRNWSACKKEPGEEPCHKQYHYTDVAIQRAKYDRAYRGTSEHDIVGAIDAAVRVLQGEPTPAPFNIRDKREALYLIAHFVGDLHQPLHVGSVYLSKQGHRIDPDVPGAYSKETETRGGNLLAVGDDNLHSLWDEKPSDADAKSIDEEALDKARAVPKTHGDISTWPEAWATDSLSIAPRAFASIGFGARKKQGGWEAKFAKGKDAYETSKERIQREQLVKAGARLAQLLNAIWP